MLTKLIIKLRTLGLNTSLCNWILDFLMGCVLSSLLYSLFTHDSNTKFADNITVVGLITNEETSYREEVGDLATTSPSM